MDHSSRAMALLVSRCGPWAIGKALHSQDHSMNIEAHLQQLLDLDLDWAVCAFGKHETACLTEALKRGGSVRVGFENNIHMPDGSLAVSNRDQVANMVKIRFKG